MRQHKSLSAHSPMPSKRIIGDITYAINIKRSAEKSINDLPKKIRHRVLEDILKLVDNPRPTGVRKLVGRKGYWRIRIANYRVIYHIIDDTLTVTVVKVAHRKKIYA